MRVVFALSGLSTVEPDKIISRVWAMCSACSLARHSTFPGRPHFPIHLGCKVRQGRILPDDF
jgi:hypothetical protein